MGLNYKTVAKIALSELGFYRRACLKATRGGNRLLVLMYHDLSAPQQPGEAPKPLRAELSVDHFECHIRSLVSAVRVITLRDAMTELRETGGFRENSVAITFDDGYKAVYTGAYPVLKQYGVGATVFVLTGWLNRQMTLWWEDLADQIRVSDLARVDVRKINEVLGFTRERKLDRMDNGNRSRSKLLDRVSSALMVLEDGERRTKMAAVQAVLAQLSGPVQPGQEPITWDEARHLSEAGIELAAHTNSHKNMSFLSAEEAERELIEGKREIERQTGQKVTGFAYPYGYDVAGYERFRPLLEKCGYEYACTSWWGNIRSDCDRYRLHRNTLPAITSPALVRRELFLDLTE